MKTLFCLFLTLASSMASAQSAESNNGFSDGQKAEVAQEVQNGFG